jgi:isopenicillin-N epimerase
MHRSYPPADRELLPLLVDSTRALSSFVGCAPHELALTPNVTTALNAVFRSLQSRVRPGHVVLRLDLAYGSVKKMLLHYFAGPECGARVREIVVPLPVSGAQIVAALRAALSEEGAAAGRVPLVVIDHVTSNSAVVLPVAALVRECRRVGALCVVDGAHALGGMDLDLEALQPDFYTSNCHKWLCNPKGAAFLYVPARNQHLMRPFIVSHGSGSGFISDFIWTGLTDYGSLLALPFVLDLWQRSGPALVRTYMHDLLQWAIDHLLGAWGTDLLADRDMFVTMATVRLPGAVRAVSADEHNEIQDVLHYKYKIEVRFLRSPDGVFVAGKIKLLSSSRFSSIHVLTLPPIAGAHQALQRRHVCAHIGAHLQ